MSGEQKESANLEIATVLFMDIIGFSRNPVEAQRDALVRLQHIVRNSGDYIAAEAAGDLIKLPTGDGMALVFFRNPLAPVRCAIHTQAALRNQPDIPLRMGIHAGPIFRHSDILENANVVGSGINMAQRVMDCGDAGHILLSRQVAEVLEQTSEWASCLRELGTAVVKHGVELHLFNLVTDQAGNAAAPTRMSGKPASQTASTATAVEEPPSIAVLPFANISGDKEQEYFSDGLAEEILNLLAKIRGLRVISRTSSFAFRGKEQDIRGIAQALSVGNVLEGSVRRAVNRVRITAQLIEARNGSRLWSERYDRDLTDVFAVQDEIGGAISEALKVQLAPRTRVVDVEAWQHWLKGVHHRARNTPEAVLKAKEHFEQALAIDPNYAQAYSGVALCYYVLTAMGARSADETTPLVNLMTEMALALDPYDSEAHMVIAVMAGVFNYDWARAGTHHRMSVAGDAVSPRARLVYGAQYLTVFGRTTEAIEQTRMALDSDPLSPIFHSGLAWCLTCAGKYPEAIACANRAREIHPNSHVPWIDLGFAQMCGQVPAEAAASFSRFVEMAPWHHMGRGCLAAACRLSGDHNRAAELKRQFPDPAGRNYGHAIYYAAAGEPDAMFEALDGAYLRRDFYLPSLAWMPVFDRYRTDPRFMRLLTRMNLA